jgi:hypothetical protein
MDLGIRAGDVFAAMAGFLYGVWPLLLVAPLGWERSSLVRIVRAMLALWALAAVAGLASYLARFPHFSIIREPANSLAFVSAGLVLIAIVVATRRRKQPRAKDA